MQAVKLEQKLLCDIEAMQPDVIDLIKTLCAIPAPSHHEERRASFIKEWFESRGMYAEIDEAKNVRIPFALDRHEDIVVIMAHTDTVFPDMEPMALREEDGKLFCPGVGDDTTNLAAMMMLADYLNKNGYEPECGVLFVANSCEEGLGNLKGCKAIMHAYGSRVKAFLSLDGGTESVCTHAVGSSRYSIAAHTQGGHSFAAFGNRNAIEALSQLVCAFYSQNVPRVGSSTTTYNVGIMNGGTSVNTIAQDAQMLYEYRSDHVLCLDMMEKQFRDILALHQSQDVQYEVELLGTRPCADGVDPAAQKKLSTACVDALFAYTGRMPAISAGSTDCNIPLSMGIPSACFGVYVGEGEHTREEWVEISSICPGMKAAAAVILNWFSKK